MTVLLSPVGGVAAQFFDNNGNPLSGGKLFSYAAGTTTPATTYTSSLGVTAHTNPIVLDSGGRVPGGEIWLTDGVIYKFVLQTSTNVLIATYDNIVGINSNFVNFTAEQEIQTATAGQTVFNLTTTQYQPGTNSLTVYVDGVNQYGPGAQYAYLETDSDTVTFVSGLHVGASVKFTTATQTTGNATDASVVSYTPPFTGGVTTNVEDKLAQTVSVMDFGAAGDGVTDDTAAIQAAITAVTVPLVTTLFPNGTGTVVFPNGKYKITGNINVTCNLQNEGGKLEVYSGGRLTFATSYVVASAIEIEVMEDFSAQIVQVSHAHITLVDFKIYSQTGDEPLHTAINIAPPLANGLFDVKIVRPYIRSCFIGIKLETAIGSGEGWITDVIISEASIIAFRLFGVRFNDAGGKGINYCSVDKLMLENVAVNSLLKYGVSCTGILFGNSFTDLKDFNDDPLLGTYFTIFCEDNDLNALAAVQGSPTLANHIMQFTRNVFSNCRVEGNISLGLLRNLYTLTDIHVYNKIGILPLMGYDYYHDYGPDMISKELDLAAATLSIANPADATFVAESNRLKVFMNANSIAQVRLDLPPWFIAAANATGYCTIGFATDFVTELGAGVNFAIRSGSPLVPIDSTTPSANMRSDERLVVLTYNLNGITLVTGDKIVIDFTGVSGEVYSVNSIYAYAQLANPVLDLTPFINTVY